MFKKIIFFCVCIGAGNLLLAADPLQQGIQTAVKQAAAKTTVGPSVTSKAKQYLYSYYKQKNFSAPQWVRVKDLFVWMEQNNARLNTQFQQAMGSAWNQFSAQQKEVAVGAWLGMKYALDKIGHAPNEQFPIILKKEIWDIDCADYSDRKTIYCSKGDFVSKFNIGLHETVHLLPYLTRAYTSGENLKNSYRELYTVVSQQRYGLPVKLDNNSVTGTRTFFPVFDQLKQNTLLDEYAEGIAALIDYDQIWEQPWNTEGANSNESFEMRLRAEVFAILRGTREEYSFYSPKAKKYFHQVGHEIVRKYCNQLPTKKEQQATYIHSCIDEHLPEILTMSAQKLRLLVSPKIPPVPKGYQ